MILRRRSYGLALHPNYAGLVIGAVVLGTELIFVLPNGLTGAAFGHLVMTVAAALGFLSSCFHYSIHKEGIMLRFLWLPLRLTPWDKVCSLICTDRWMDKDFREERLQRQPLVGKKEVVILRSAGTVFYTTKEDLAYDPRKEIWLLFKLRHPLATHKLHVPDSQKAIVGKVLEKHYPGI